MQVNAKDLELLHSRGEDFEQLLHDLVAAEAFRHKLPLHAVSWDPNVYRSDGGRDVLVTQRHDDADYFIPRERSVWSAKSGAAGLDSSAMIRELNHNAHEPLRQHLNAGGIYVWCTPRAAGHDIAEEFKAAFATITKPDGSPSYSPTQLIFYSASQLATVLNKYPAIVSKYFPHLPHIFRSCCPIAAWDPTGDSGCRTPFVSSPARYALIDRVRSHFSSYEGNGVLHIAGLSGVGKTRVVHEAVKGRLELASALYVPQYDPSVRDTIRNLKTRDPSRLFLVLDEVPMADYAVLSREFDSDTQVRIVTIGPAPRDAASRLSSVLIVSPPDTASDVLPVLQESGNGLSGPVLASIADRASHDLRLGLLLIRATQSNPEFIDLPVPDGAEMWRRICWLYRDELSCTKDFASTYPFLTVAIDIGYQHPDEDELDSIAQFFGVSGGTLLDVLLKANDVGLGYRTPHFFEAGPRALAIHLFQQTVFSRVRARFGDLMQAVRSERLRRRIVERCHELSGESRKKADEVVTDFFQGELGDKDITQLTNTSAAATFKAWAELDPGPALRWLRDSLWSSSDEQIAELDRRELLTSSPSPRRQIVWLCEGMAAFSEHFANSESILFRLSAVETERGIGNNSIGVWKGLFVPVLAFTEVPFTTRARLLLDRLRDANPNTAAVVVDAVIGALATYFGGRCAPPHVVGGYLTPPPWMPKTAAELRGLQVELATRYLEMALRLPADIRAIAMEKAVKSLGAFHRLGVLGQLRTLLEHFGNDLLNQARIEASALVVFHDREEAEEDGEGPGTLGELLAFEKELSPKTLIERIEDVTTRHTWDVAKRIEWDAAKESVDPYVELASLLSAAPPVLAQCEPLFTSERIRSDASLGAACGARDDADAFAATAESWLQAGVCGGFLSGFLQGMAGRCGALPARWSNHLDQVADTHPQLVADLTLASEPTKKGLARLFALVGSGRIRPSCMLRIASRTWAGAVRDVGEAELVNVLLHVRSGARAEALSAALKLAQVWGDFGKASFGQDLAAECETLLGHTIGSTHETDAWVDTLTSLGRSAPLRALDLAAQALVRDTSRHAIPTELLLPVLRELSAAHPADAMEAVGQILLNPMHHRMCGVLKFHGLFDAIGVDAVRAWAKDKDTEVVALIARHLDSPTIESGSPVVPPLADWLFQEYGMDVVIFDAFCAGRHAFEIRLGTARDRQADLNALLEPFRYDRREWVRKWVEYEERLSKYEEKWDAIHEENVERR